MQLANYVDCWQGALVLAHMDFSTGLIEFLYNIAADLPERKRSNRARQKLQYLLGQSHRCSTLFFLQYPIVTPFIPCSVWEGTTQNLNTRRLGSLRAFLEAGWKRATAASLSMVLYSKETPVSHSKALKSNWNLYCRLQKRHGRKNDIAESPVKVLNFLLTHVSPKSHSSQLLSKISLLPSLLKSSHLSCHPSPLQLCRSNNLFQFSILPFTLKYQEPGRHS